jgi:hypothetical protein
MATNKNGQGAKGKKNGESLRQTYDRLKKEFTAADLQKYTYDEPMIPAQQWLQEMEVFYKAAMQKKKKRKT